MYSKKTTKKDLMKIIEGMKLDALKKDEVLNTLQKTNQSLSNENVNLVEELEEEKNKPVVVSTAPLDDEHILFLQERIKNCIHPHMIKLYEQELFRMLKL